MATELDDAFKCSMTIDQAKFFVQVLPIPVLEAIEKAQAEIRRDNTKTVYVVIKITG